MVFFRNSVLLKEDEMKYMIAVFIISLSVLNTIGQTYEGKKGSTTNPGKIHTYIYD